MALPTLTKTWQYNVNQALPALGTDELSARQYIYAIKTSLIGFAQNPWQVVKSCNGTSVSNGDLWTSAAAPAVSYAAPATNPARGWIVLKNPNMSDTPAGFQILIDMIFGNGVSWVGSFCSPSAGFTGGTITARPTATDIRQFVTGFNAGDSSLSTWGYQNNGYGWSANRAYRFHAMMSTDGKCTRLFNTHVNGTSRVGQVTLFEMLKNVPAGVNPYIHCNLCGGNNQTDIGTLFYASGVEGQNLDFTIGGSPARGTMIAESAAFSQSFANEISGEWPMWPLGAGILQTLTTSTANRPIMAPGIQGRVGDFHDLWIGSSGVATKDTYPADASKQFVQMGINLIVPWNGTDLLDV